MLIEQLGYRAPQPSDLVKFLLGRKPDHPWAEKASIRPFFIPAAVLHSGPLISYSGIVPMAPLGVASLLGGRLRTQRAWFLLSPTWSIEKEATAKWFRRQAVMHRMLNPRHRFVFMCNTDAEAALMRSFGEAAFRHNKTTNIAEGIFKPLDGETIEFDAIYNAQLAPWKRHELAVEIPRCAFLFYRGIESTSESEAALIASHKTIAPEHVFINEIDDNGAPVRLPPEEVNRHLNRATVGLCLSEEEGAMFASAEYLLSGLPVVTTPNKGGRDFYLDDEFCIETGADPREIAAGVAALKARGIPRHAVRERTMRRILSERSRFIEFVNAVYTECGIGEKFQGFWPIKRPSVMEWIKPRAARKRAVRGMVDNLIASDIDAAP